MYNAAKISRKFFYNKKFELSEITYERNRKSHTQNWKIYMHVVGSCKHVLILQNNDSNLLTLKVAKYLHSNCHTVISEALYINSKQK